jgi:hypothetical protein
MILFAILQNRAPASAEDLRRDIVLHYDSTSPYTARLIADYPLSDRLVRAACPVFSLDLAAFDFRPFGKVKMVLMGTIFGSGSQLFQNVTHILNGIPRKELETGFDQWLVRLSACIRQQGEYVKCGKLNRCFHFHLFLT